MRVLFAVLLVAVPGLVAAQSRPLPDPPPILPTIGLPLPSIGLPLPSPRVERPVTRGDRRPPPTRRDPRDGDRRDHRGDGKRGRHPAQSVVYFVPAYGLGYQAGAPVSGSTQRELDEEAPPPQAPARPTGTLWLDLQMAGDAQVYVDSVYVGTVGEIGAELTLEAGTHGLEIRAPGQQTLNVDVKIEAGRAITYRGALQPQATPAATGERDAGKPAPVAEKKTPARKPFYAIPGCYLGDVPPKDANLPATCDASRAITIWP